MQGTSTARGPDPGPNRLAEAESLRRSRAGQLRNLCSLFTLMIGVSLVAAPAHGQLDRVTDGQVLLYLFDVVGDVVPDSVINASLGEPIGRGSMTLYPLNIEFTPGADTVERLGNNSKDYGQIMIESNNPKVTKMQIALKFSLEGR